MRRARLTPLLAAATVASVFTLIVSACSDGDDAAPDPGPRPQVTSTTVIDYSGVLLARVRGETTTTIRTTGSMVLRGTVLGPGGPLAGATVRIERITSAGSHVTDVSSDGAGSYELRGVPGGRYRIRAFQAPRYIQLEPVIEFLPEREQHDIDLQVEAISGLQVTAAAAPNPPTVGNPVNVVVQVVTREVGTDGVVRGSPQVGVPVELAGLGSWVAASGSDETSLRASTDGSGRARFALTCARAGDPGLSARVLVAVAAPPPADPAAAPAAPTTQTEVVNLSLPACVQPPPASTSSTSTTAPDETTTTDGSTTSTTDPDDTTSTTEPDQ